MAIRKVKSWNVAMRGRWHYGRWVQQFEVNQTNVWNNLTTIQKDNMVLERWKKC